METMRPFDDKAPIGWEVARFIQSKNPADLEVALCRALGHERRLVNDLLTVLRAIIEAVQDQDNGAVVAIARTAIIKAEGAEPVPAAEFIELAGTDEGESAELLPCPFCGPGESRVSLWHDDVAKRWRVGCGRCGASTGTSPRDKGQAVAVAAWNKRGESVVDELKAMLRDSPKPVPGGVSLKARNHQEEIDSAVADERDDLRAGAEVRAALKARGL